MPESRTSPRRIMAAEKRNRALQLRIAGATYEQIARTPISETDARPLYKDRKRAHEAVMVALKELAQDTAGKGAELKALELARLESMQISLWPATRPTKKVVCENCQHVMYRETDKEAIDRVLRIMERRSRYLGLDAQKGAEQDHSSGESMISALMDAIEAGVPEDDESTLLGGDADAGDDD
jgi:hypothetical protein